MPSGKFHTFVSMTAGAIAGGAVYYGTRDPASAIALGGACMAGIVISPDLDEPNPTHSHTEVRRGCGLLLAAAWWLFWLPYTRIVTRHRSLLSHFPVISTAGRVGYLGTVFLPILWLIKPLLPKISIPYIALGSRFQNFIPAPIGNAVKSIAALNWSIPGIEVWLVFLAAFLALTVLAFMKVDLPQELQVKMFWIFLGVGLIGGVLWVLMKIPGGMIGMARISIAAWLFIGLSLSDTLHALADWYLPWWV